MRDTLAEYFSPADIHGQVAGHLFPASLVAAQLCLFGPQTIYVGNVAEFSAPFWALVPPLLAAGGAIVLALVAVGVRMTAHSTPTVNSSVPFVRRIAQRTGVRRTAPCRRPPRSSID